MLVLSAPVGEGHVAAARALAARMRGLWPAARVREVEGTGRGSARRDRALQLAYARTMRHAPRLYGLGYDLLVRFPRAAELFKALTAARLGRALNITQGTGSQLLTAPQPHGWVEVGGRVFLER